MKLEPLLQLGNSWTGIALRFAVHVFEGHLSIPDMQKMEVFGDGWHARSPRPTVELVIIHPSDSRMSHDERVRMGGLIKRWEASRRASATVILADGMLGAVHRSVLTGLQFLAPPSHPTKVFSTNAEAVTWLLPHVNAVCASARGELAAVEVSEAVEDFSARFMTRPKP